MELLGRAEKTRRPIVIQCHMPVSSGRENRACSPLVLMIWPVPTETGFDFLHPLHSFPQQIRSFPGHCPTSVLRSPRNSPVSLGFQRRNRNRGSGADDPTDGLALSLIHCRKKHGAPTSCPLERSSGDGRAVRAAVGGRFRDSLATPWLWPASEPWHLRRVLAWRLVWLEGLGWGPSG